MSRELPLFLMGKIFLPEGYVLHGESLAYPEAKHTHDFVEIVYIDSGKIDHIVNGKESAMISSSLV